MQEQIDDQTFYFPLNLLLLNDYDSNVCEKVFYGPLDRVLAQLGTFYNAPPANFVGWQPPQTTIIDETLFF